MGGQVHWPVTETPQADWPSDSRRDGQRKEVEDGNTLSSHNISRFLWARGAGASGTATDRSVIKTAPCVLQTEIWADLVLVVSTTVYHKIYPAGVRCCVRSIVLTH